ncbi:claudin 15-like b isoform X1 [Colossoma macropomum]|uniref:claudin 15-like b isoform X1 n=1 Tax=Colossoma macropomum TaxID=42526 RepID=UPI0018649025|nr:claudin 15-like b isoform X1 [Colossoma macropomum]
MAEVVVEVLGLILAILGWCLESSSTNSAMWRVHSHVDAVVTSSSQYQGLWITCAANAMGAVQCQRYKTILGLPGYVQACRALMIIALLLGLFSILLSALGLKCTKLGSMSDLAKGRLTLTAGVLFILSGVCVLTAVSWYAARIVQEFNDPFYVGTKFELGTGLYLGWAAAVLVILGGAMLCGSFRRASSQTNSGAYSYNYSGQGQKIYKAAPTADSGSSKAYV